MKILSWNCEGGFFTKGKYKLIKKYDADIMIVQECSNPSKSIDREYEKNPHYKKDEVEDFIELYPNPQWLPDYNKCEVKMEDKGREEKHRKYLGQKGIAIFAKKNILLEKDKSFVNNYNEKITWWSEKDKNTNIEVPIIENNALKSFNPVYINKFDLLLLGVHTKAPERPNKLKWLGQIKEYLRMNEVIFRKYKKIIIAGDLNAGFKESDKKKYCELVKTYDKNYNLKCGVQNYSEKFIPTHYKNRIGYIDDFVFLSKCINVKNIEPTSEWNQNKDGEEKWGYIDEENKGSDHCPLILEVEIQ